MERAVSPLEGLPAKLKWLPALAEVRAECEEIQAPDKALEASRQRAIEWERQAHKQLAERQEFEQDQKHRPTYDELRAKHDGPNGEKWGLYGGEIEKKNTREEAQKSLVNRFGQAALDAVPNRKANDYHRETWEIAAK